MEKFKYVYNCVNPEDLDELHYIIDNGEEISREDFLKAADNDDLEEIEKSLGYNSTDFKMENDYHVNYFKAEYKGERIYYFCWSAIEYVFKRI